MLWSAHCTHSSHRHLNSPPPGVYYWLQLEHLQSLGPHSTKVVLTKSHRTKLEQLTSVWLLLKLLYAVTAAWRKVPAHVKYNVLSRNSLFTVTWLIYCMSQRIISYPFFPVNYVWNRSCFHVAAVTLFLFPWPLTSVAAVIKADWTWAATLLCYCEQSWPWCSL